VPAIIMTPLEIALVGVALGLVLLTGTSVLPGLLVLLRPSRLRTWFLDADLEAQVLSASPLLEECVQRLKAQHFFLLGVKVEKLPLWGREDREVALAARDQSAFASIVLQPFGAVASVYLYSPLAGGGMVFTRDYGGGLRAEDERLSVCSVPTTDLEELVSHHHGRVEAMQARGAVLALHPTQAGRLEATRAFYASNYFRRAALPHVLPGAAGLAVSLLLLLWAVVAPFVK
jgi:hypothetical protein